MDQKDIIGKKFGRLTALRFSHTKNYKQYWIFKCDCGNEHITQLSHVKRGKIKSCGCYLKEHRRQFVKTHGLSKTRIYKTWKSMKHRVLNKKDKRYHDYGGRGILICDEWKNNFLSFYNWAMKNGYKDNLTIDRIDVNGNYEPSNCRWATPLIQANNQRRNHYITYNGKTQSMSDWARELGISYTVLRARINSYFWSIEKSLTTPVSKSK